MGDQLPLIDEFTLLGGNPGGVEAIRRSLRGGLPYGSSAWVEAIAEKLARPLERRPPGRPRKAKT